ncbi:hypothetical protein [Asanoa iriomotensis]|uniref:DUF2637 domain-containing protein n=1 Tax=Asanoa iriomotensis TaxID=234613 RepID=A0ABQ4CFI2_9ACTN|nr:hypothetical protein [Asanoa iriomotensis]GIF61530.1 hypothetical protein Air01nite_76250 [Asanoa iriomotensis]
MTSDNQHGEPRLASVASWAVLAASFGLSATTWVALAELAGFTATLSIADLVLRLAWLMPVAVDGYVVVALVLWMSPVPPRVAAFAKRNTYGAAGIGIAAQSAYHLLHTASTTDQLWRVVLAAIVGALPPAVAALAVHMRALIRREGSKPVTPAPTPSVPAAPDRSTIADRPAPTPTVTTPAPPVRQAPEPVPTPEPTPVPATVADRPQVPTPAEVASRINPTPTTGTATRPAPVDERRTAPPRPHKSAPRTPAPALAPSATDTRVSVPDAAQLTLPVVSPDLLKRATEVARQYRNDNGTPITAGKLAVELRITSKEAAQALAHMDLLPDNPTTPVPTVNGNRPARAAR